MSSTIVWLRRDLRLQDNTALNAALVDDAAPVILLYILDPALLDGDRYSTPRMAFLLDALRSLDAALRTGYERRLLVRLGEPIAVLREVIDETGATALYFNRDTTPYARKRDTAVNAALTIPVRQVDDLLLRSPDAVLKDDGKPYTVYTPYMKRWKTLTTPHQPAAPVLSAQRLHPLDGIGNMGVPTLADLKRTANDIVIPEASEQVAQALLDDFTRKAISAYADERNALANPAWYAPDAQANLLIAGTSALSPYLRFGLLSPRQAYWAAREAYAAAPREAARTGIETWVNELIWREFYNQILYHFPHVAWGNFNRKYDVVQWRDASDDFAAWAAGQTGYPVVDAAMRQLRATGWMHNRARMIVASFLTKHLLIDWRMGERHFMRWLLDGDIAANNGGWQWAAGTGTDAQPYFRIFNPVNQSQKFDPTGAFIRYWLPELRAVPDKFIHTPWLLPTPPQGYPAPIVDHAFARRRALAAYGVVKGE